MRTYLDCIPCFFRQALEAARISGADKITQRKILNKLAKTLPEFSLNATPPEMACIIYGMVKKATHQDDPYRKIKAKSNKLALKIYAELRSKLSKSDDRLLKAVEMAIAGNIIDYGVKNSLNIKEELKRILNTEENIFKKNKNVFIHYADFKNILKKAKNILYLADNAGETVFDRVLIEEIKRIDENKKLFTLLKTNL
jgi:damage-control phosphatase, subfamily I